MAGFQPTLYGRFWVTPEAVVTFPAHVTEQPTRNYDDPYTKATEPDGSSRLTVIYIGGKRTALELEQNQANSQSSMPDSK